MTVVPEATVGDPACNLKVCSEPKVLDAARCANACSCESLLAHICKFR